MKQIIVVDASLALPPGKLAAQVAHASVAALLRADPEDRRAWLSEGMPKVVLSCDGAAQLEDIAARCTAVGLAAYLVRDAGRTVVEPGTVTCIGIGPAENKRIDAITGALPLLP